MEKAFFLTYDDLFQDLTDSVDGIRANGPWDYIVGVPRSGITPAVNLSIMLNGIPYSDLNTFMIGKATQHNNFIDINITRDTRILLVDDTSSNGAAMTQAYGSLLNYCTTKWNVIPQVMRFVVWGSAYQNELKYDMFCKVYPRPRLFEWNIWKNGRIKDVAFDMDGVLCKDPTRHENDKGPRLIDFYKKAPPKFLPKKKIGYIITNRLERNRSYTEEWLEKHNIDYGELIMKENEKEGHVEHKVRKIGMLKDKLIMYVESSIKQSRGIAEVHKDLPVWCIDNRLVYNKRLK